MEERVYIKEHKKQDIPYLQDINSGPHLEEFISYKKQKMNLSDMSTANLRNTTCDILSYCNPHDAVTNMNTTHLVVGYVQSGKTLSFTSLIELALDYKYRIVIIFAGVTTNLLSQTTKRLKKDLKCNNVSNNKFFKVHVNPEIEDASSIAKDLKNKKTILVIPVLKHWDRISRLAKMFEDESVKKQLCEETTLIIDDEADQASLNNYGRKNTNPNNSDAERYSSTFNSIMELRNVLSGNSYIQYTATPQANILINEIDILSPKTHTLLYPGEGYCGGKQFFGLHGMDKMFDGKLIKNIPDNEVFDKKDPPIEIPKSLEEALMLHLLAVTLVIRYYKVPEISQLSMMVHVDPTLNWNRTFQDWINKKLEQWIDDFDSKDIYIRSLISNQFKLAYVEAARLYNDAPDYIDIEEMLIDTISDTYVYRITGDSDDGDELDWDAYSSNILVGAQMLNRGFTVENLTTTYMPRYAKTVTNADTIEQRCRFFGYKMDYIRSCRVYLPNVSIANYEDYVNSEEELRLAMSETNSMEELGHKILTSPKMRPTRSSVLPYNTVNECLSGMHEFSSYHKANVMEFNYNLVEKFYTLNKGWTKFSCYNYNPDEYTGLRLHEGLRVGVDEAINLLKSYVFTDTEEIRYRADSIRYIRYLSQINDVKLNGIQFIMIGSRNLKERSTDNNNRLTSNLFNGPSSFDDNSNYPGDRNIYASDTITVQLHKVHISNINYTTYSIAIYFPVQYAQKYCTTNID